MTREYDPQGKQRRILAFIERYITQHGYSPTIREITKGANLSSTSVTVYHLELLENNDLIVRDAKKARTLRLA